MIKNKVITTLECNF